MAEETADGAGGVLRRTDRAAVASAHRVQRGVEQGRGLAGRRLRVRVLPGDLLGGIEQQPVEDLAGDFRVALFGGGEQGGAVVEEAGAPHVELGGECGGVG